MALRVLLLTMMTALAAPAKPQSEFAESLDATFRGCQSAGWCAFWIESLDPLAKSLYRVYPEGVARSPGHAVRSAAIRDRLNVLLASMVHQHKRILLFDLQDLGDGTYSAVVTVNEENIASDPIIRTLHESAPTAGLPESN